MLDINYLMENKDEILRLELKTDLENLRRQALWAGLKPGMRVADLACGPGKTTDYFSLIVQPGGEVVGIDSSEKRIDHAKKNHSVNGPSFVCRNLLEPIDDLGLFDFIWVRFFLEYYRNEAFEIVKNISRMLRPNGILCLVDLDHNCLNHYGIPDRLYRTITKVMEKLEEKDNFDTRIGIKLYSFLYDSGFTDIEIMMEPHHLIYGELSPIDDFNWTKKIETAVKKGSKTILAGYKNGYEEFYQEFKQSFKDPRRFTYTPLICCRGIRPV